MQTISSKPIPIKTWAEDLEPEALEQASHATNIPSAFKWLALMPDAHTGFGMPIGGVLATTEVIVPGAVGVDIGCGMRAVKTDWNSSLDERSVREILRQIKDFIPTGFDHHRSPRNWPGFSNAPDSKIVQSNLDAGRFQLCTLGGGNHFIEIQFGADGHVWLMVHSGSRNVGYQVANHYMTLARKNSRKWFPDFTHQDLACFPLESCESREYIAAMQFCLDFARENRAQMMASMVEAAQIVGRVHVLETIDVHHNYAALETHYHREVYVHRKGAIRAGKGEVGIIPGSQGTPSYIVEGLANPESFNSCSHGAGRAMGRKQAMRQLDLKTEQVKMKGVIHGMNSVRQLDEAPGAYKDIDEVIQSQTDLVQVRLRLTPLGVVKG